MLNTEIMHKLNDVNFPVAIQPLDDASIPDGEYYKIMRTDTDVFMGMCKSRYKPLKHMDAFGGAIQQMQGGGLDFTDAKIDVSSYEYGAMAKMEIMLPKHHVKIGNHDLYLKYVARNSYNGRWKFQSFFGWLNQVCFNTLVTGQKLAYSADRHTLHFDVNQVNVKIKNAVKAVTDETENFKKWWDKPVDDTKVVELYKKTLCNMKHNDMKILAGANNVNQKQLNNLMDMYGNEVTHIKGSGDYGRNGAKGTLWCVFQSATEWSTHLRDIVNVDKTKMHIVQEKRQAQVRKMVQSKDWKELETA